MWRARGSAYSANLLDYLPNKVRTHGPAEPEGDFRAYGDLHCRGHRRKSFRKKNFLEATARGLRRFRGSLEPLVKSAEFKFVLPRKLSLRQAALLKKGDELLPCFGRVVASSASFAFFHRANLT